MLKPFTWYVFTESGHHTRFTSTHAQRQVDRRNLWLAWKPDNSVLVIRRIRRINQDLLCFRARWVHPNRRFERDTLERRNPQHRIRIGGRCSNNFNTVAHIRDHSVFAAAVHTKYFLSDPKLDFRFKPRAHGSG